MARYRDYDLMPGLRNSRLSDFERSPMHYQHGLTAPGKRTPALSFGTSYHVYVLENNLFKQYVEVMDESQRPFPDKNYQTHANRDWKAAFLELAEIEKKEVITLEDFEKMKLMREKLYKNDLARELLECHGNKFEEPSTWMVGRTQCKCLKDITNPAFLCDLKTDRDADPDHWKRSFYGWNYDRQSGMYSDGDAGGNYTYGSGKDFFYIAQEPEPPFAVAVYKIRREVVDHGVRRYRDLVDKYQMCEDSGIWQGYEFKSVAGSMFEIDLPAWMNKD
jgi:hypothetical protein